jgi:asparagine synthase (glutamine-hydrolysing)
LTSQPLVELCLRIPVHLCIAGAWDRAIARRAFAADVPAEILWRRTKGGIDSYVKEALRRNARFVREMLLDGLLVQSGLLDKARLEEALGDAAIGTRIGSAEIFDHLTTEAWLRRWQSDDAQPDYQRLRSMTPTLRPMGLALAPSK